MQDVTWRAEEFGHSFNGNSCLGQGKLVGSGDNNKERLLVNPSSDITHRHNKLFKYRNWSSTCKSL